MLCLSQGDPFPSPLACFICKLVFKFSKTRQRPTSRNGGCGARCSKWNTHSVLRAVWSIFNSSFNIRAIDTNVAHGWCARAFVVCLTLSNQTLTNRTARRSRRDKVKHSARQFKCAKPFIHLVRFRFASLECCKLCIEPSLFKLH